MGRIIGRYVVAIVGACCAGSALAAGGLSLTVWPVPPINSGTTYSIAASFQLQDGTVAVRHAPFTLRVTLPPGVTYTGYLGGGWTCTQAPGNVQQIVCTFASDLTSWNYQSSGVGINAVVDPNVVPGPTSVVATLESAELPLPPQPVCGPSPSTTGCTNDATSYVHSYVDITDWGATSGWVQPGRIATWTGPLFEATAISSIDVEFTNHGYGPINTPVTLDVLLPPGLHYNNGNNSLPSFTCTAQALGANERVRCTTPYMYDSQHGFVALFVRVAADVAVPGPLVAYATLYNNVQAAPDCVANPAQTACGKLTFSTRAARTANVTMVGVTHAPGVAVIGQDVSPLTVNFHNIGEGNATASAVHLKLPPGFSYAQTLASSPTLTCSASGTSASGQTLSCTGVGLVAGGTGYVSLAVHVDDHAEAPGPVPVVAALDAVLPSNATALLTACATNPNQPTCAWHDVPTFYPCALQYGPDAIYCDNFQVHVH